MDDTVDIFIKYSQANFNIAKYLGIIERLENEVAFLRGILTGTLHKLEGKE